MKIGERAEDIDQTYILAKMLICTFCQQERNGSNKQQVKYQTTFLT